MVLIGKVAVFDPAGTVTAAGSDAIEGLLLVRATIAPFVALLLKVSVAVTVLPLAMLLGLSTRDDTDSPEELDGVTVTKAVFCADAPCGSVTVTVAVTRVEAETTGGWKVTFEPNPVNVPPLPAQL